MYSTNHEPLRTVTILNNNIGKSLLCRLSQYENRKLNILRDSKKDLKVFNKYFFISPKEKVKEPDLPMDKPLVETTISIPKPDERLDDLDSVLPTIVSTETIVTTEEENKPPLTFTGRK